MNSWRPGGSTDYTFVGQINVESVADGYYITQHERTGDHTYRIAATGEPIKLSSKAELDELINLLTSVRDGKAMTTG